MKLWVKKLIVFIIAGISYLLGQFYRGSWFVNSHLAWFCKPYLENGVKYCNSPYVLTVGWPLIYLGKILFIIAVILLFAHRSSFRAWLKTSIFYIPLAVIAMLIIYPVRFFPGAPLSTFGEGVRPFGFLYILITLGIVIWGIVAYRIASHPER